MSTDPNVPEEPGPEPDRQAKIVGSYAANITVRNDGAGVVALPISELQEAIEEAILELMPDSSVRVEATRTDR